MSNCIYNVSYEYNLITAKTSQELNNNVNDFIKKQHLDKISSAKIEIELKGTAIGINDEGNTIFSQALVSKIVDRELVKSIKDM